MFGIRPFFTTTEISVGSEGSVGRGIDFLGELVRGVAGDFGGGGDFIREGVGGPFRALEGDSGRGGGGGDFGGGGGDLGGRGLLLIALVLWLLSSAIAASARACASLSLSAAMASSLDIPECWVLMPRVLVRPRMPRRSPPRSMVGLPRDFGIPGRGSGGCSSIAT